jgi:hypothetical protein
MKPGVIQTRCQIVDQLLKNLIPADFAPADFAPSDFAPSDFARVAQR